METGLDLIQKYTGEKAIKETYEETLLLENFSLLEFFSTCSLKCPWELSEFLSVWIIEITVEMCSRKPVKLLRQR